MPNSTKLESEQNRTNECGLCGGSGKVWAKAMPNASSFVHDLAGEKICPSCRGTGQSHDRLTKVMPLGKPDLLK